MSQGFESQDGRSAETWFGHPRVLFVLFFAELWERFSFYGMRALLVLYMTDKISGGFGYGDGRATGVYAAYGTLVYAFPILGGWLADKFMGYRKAVFWGGSLMAAGHFAMAFEFEWVFYLALGLISIGNGFFKPNISSMVGQLYEKGDPRRDGGFTIFYMGINIGAGVAPLLCGYLGETYGWAWGFGLAGIGMVVGLVVFMWGQHQLDQIGLPPDDGKALKKRVGPLSAHNLIFTATLLTVPIAALLLDNYQVSKILLGLAGLGVIIPILIMAAKSETVQRHRIYVYLILWVFHTAFWAFFEQAGSSLTLFADRNVDRNLFGFTVPTSWFQSVNPAFIVLLGPFFSMAWAGLARMQKNPSIPAKFGLGLLQIGLGFGILVLGAKFMASEGLTPVTILVLMYLLHTMGELCLSPVGLSAVTKLAPQKAVGFFMGSWFLSIAAAHTLAGVIAGETKSEDLPAEESLEIYSSVYLNGTYILIGLGVFLLVTSRLINRWTHGVK